MASQHEISEYIENLPLQKTLCKGYRPDDVYEVICNLSSMYNQLLSESLLENEELKRRLEYMEKAGNMDIELQIPVIQDETNDSLESASIIEETVAELEKLLDMKKLEVEDEVTQNKMGFELSDIPLFQEMNTSEKIESAEEDMEDIKLEEITATAPVEEVEKIEMKQEKSLSDKELQKLKRGDLLEILLELSKENDSLVWKLAKKDQEIKGLEEKLADRKIDLQKAGTIADASFKLNGVLEAAEGAAQQYLENLQRLYEREEYLCNVKEKEVEERCKALIENTHKKCEEYIQMTEEKCAKRERDAEEKCQYLDQKAKTDVDKRWNELSRRLEDFYSSHRGLRELLATSRML